MDYCGDDAGVYGVQPTFIDQHQAQVVPRRVLLVDISESRRQIKAAKEQPDRNSFACGQSAMFKVDLALANIREMQAAD
jgi:hypothetical protein